MTSSSYFFYVVFSLVEFSYWYKFNISIIIGFGIMTIFFYKGLTRNPEIPLPKFCPISGDWGKLWIPNLVRMSLTKCYWMLQNAMVAAFTVFELLRENQQMVKFSPPPRHPPPRLGLKTFRIFSNETPVLLLTLCSWYFSCLHMYSEKFFNIYFNEQIFLKIYLTKGDTGQSFLEIIAYE